MKLTTTLVAWGILGLSAALPAPGSTEIPDFAAIATRTLKERRDSSVPTWASGAWTAVPCTETHITDASIPADERWDAVHAQDAWTQLMDAWNKATPSGHAALNFGAFAFNQFNQGDDKNCADISNPGCSNTVLCATTGYPAAGFLLLNSIVGLHVLGAEAYNALSEANLIVDSKMASFSGNFAKFPQDDSKVIKLVVDGIVGGLSVGLATVWNVLIKDTALAAKESLKGFLQDSSYALVSAAGNFIKDGIIPPPADVYQETVLFQTFKSTFTLQLRDLFAHFVLRTLSAQNSTTQAQLTNLVHGGAVLKVQQAQNGSKLGEMSAALTSLLFGKLIQSAWAVSSNKQRPFILRVDKSDYKCGSQVGPLSPQEYEKALALGKINLALWMTDDVAKATRWCDPDGNSWFLLNAHYSQAQQQCETGQLGRAQCDSAERPFQLLDGGNATNLDGHHWGNVTIENIVRSSYGGFLANHHKNGYVMPINSSLIVYDNLTATENGPLPLMGGITTPGFFNFPICLDARAAAKNIRNDPAQTSTPCDEYGGDSNPENAGYKPGLCGVNVKQYQKNEPNEINPLPDYQMEITIIDGNKNQIGFATKQDAGHALIVDSRLPMGLIVQDGHVDNDPVCFWYSTQWWCSNDQQHHCNFGKYENGRREGNCDFTCVLPSDTSDGPAAQPVPSDAVVAESLDGSRPTSTTAASASQPTHASGQCGVHVRQYQKNEGPNTDNPTGEYELEITLFDAKKKVVGTSGKVSAPAGKQVTVNGILPKSFFAVTKRVDADPIQFNYDMQSWDSSHGCALGSYDSGHRDMDCGFTC